MAYLYIFGCIAFTVYGQLILKWRIGEKGELPEALPEKLFFLVKLPLDPYIFSGFVAAFLASRFRMGAMTEFDILCAYPFMSLAFVLVPLLSVVFVGEADILEFQKAKYTHHRERRHV
jgi:hypothetical protein